jgi:iduronate 2-sulfatase
MLSQKQWTLPGYMSQVIQTVQPFPTRGLLAENLVQEYETFFDERAAMMIRLLIAMLLMLESIGTIFAAEHPNVLFISVDDLRPELACYGKQHIHSPNIDQLAKNGVLFERAYCMVPTCGASRASLMTGIRPARNRFVNYLTWAEKDAPGITTFNTQFRKSGYYTVSLGKIFHHPEDNAKGWSEPAWIPKRIPWYRQPENDELHKKRQKQGKRKRGPAWESAEVPDNAYADGVLAERAIADLRRLKTNNQPFFLAVGFFKPHLPFIAPKKYWDLYDREKIQLPDNYRVPKDAPKESIHTSGELRAYSGIPAKGPVSDETARNLIHGYYACVRYRCLSVTSSGSKVLWTTRCTKPGSMSVSGNQDRYHFGNDWDHGLPGVVGNGVVCFG